MRRPRWHLFVAICAVLAVTALFVGGMLKGLSAYRGTIKRMDSKAAELKAAQEVKYRVAQLAAAHGNLSDLLEHAEQVRTALDDYREQLNSTLDRKHDPDKGFMELQIVDAARQQLDEFERAAREISTHPMYGPGNGPDNSLPAITIQLQHDADDLVSQVSSELGKTIIAARPQYRSSMITMVLAAVLGSLLMIGVAWVFYRAFRSPAFANSASAGRILNNCFTLSA